MAIFVYITPECQKDAQGQGCWPEVQKFAQRVRKEQRTSILDHFPPPYLKKRFRRQERLIASERNIGEHLVVIFHRLLIRGSKPYEHFLLDPLGYGDQHFQGMVGDETLHEMIVREMEEEPPEPKPAPSEVEQQYLWSVYADDGNTANDVFLYESKEWIQAVSSERLAPRLYSLSQLVEELAIECAKAPHGAPYQVLAYDGLSLVYRHFPQHNKMLLLDVCLGEWNPSGMLERYRSVLEEKEVADIDILKCSRRGYPSLLLLDPDAWMKLENNQGANLALSPEEGELLDSVHLLQKKENDAKATGFPLFINGRAGSGKSTILQYLFADYFRLHLLAAPGERLASPPLYLTYSEELVKRSRTQVKNLLMAHHKAKLNEMIAGTVIAEGDIERELPRAIRVFRAYLLSLLPKQDRERFQAETYVDYKTFKQRWWEKFGRESGPLRQAGPSTSWHVIRSFIKGTSEDGYLEPEDYLGVGSKERNVSPEIYCLIYEKVWQKWYQPRYEAGEMWDDQDLVRHLLVEELVPANVPAIFCDEAQDFTRVELEFLLQASLFSQRNLNVQSLSRIPFAFAGDPFQTLNPTGFRWDAIKAAFVNKFIHSLDLRRGQQARSDLNYRELTLNYRSSLNIVKLCNTIQALRMALFNYQDLEPQDTWPFEESTPMPVVYDVEEAWLERVLRENSEVQVIVPCVEGEEAQYVARDSLLNRIINCDDHGVPQNVMSPSRAKGLEYSRVVMYKFGERAVSELGFSAEALDQVLTGDAALPFEYFINELYVAASRPQRRLFVIDTQQGLMHFWGFATDQAQFDRLCASIRNQADWRDRMGTLVYGSESHWSGDEESPVDVAGKQQEEGMSNRDPFLLRQAALTYSTLKGYDREASMCRAHAYRFERDYLKAGEYFRRAGEATQAFDCFWQGGSYAPLLHLAREHRALAGRPELRLADYCQREPNLSRLADLFDDLMQGDVSEAQPLPLTRKGWPEAITNALTRTLPTNAHRTPYSVAPDWTRVYRHVASLLPQGTRIPQHTCAQVAYLAGDFARALAHWEQAEEPQPQAMQQARTHLALQREQQQQPLTREDLSLLANHYRAQDARVQAASYYRKAGDQQMVLDLIEQANRERKWAEMDELVPTWVATLTEVGLFEEVITLLTEQRYQGKGRRWFQRRFGQDGTRYRAIFAQHLASSGLLAGAENRKKELVSDFLKTYFLEASNTRWLPYLHPLVVGAAMERAGRNIDCLAFYERIQENSRYQEGLRRAAGIRWARVKWAQAQREGETPKLKKRAESHRRAAQEKLKHLQVPASPDDAPLYPLIEAYLAYQGEKDVLRQETEPVRTSPAPAVEPARTTQVERVPLGAITASLLRAKQVLSLEHQETLDTVKIVYQPGREAASSLAVEIEQNGFTFHIDAWDLQIDLKHRRDPKTAYFRNTKSEETWHIKL